MENVEKILNKYGEKFDQIDKKFTVLQDLILNMKMGFDLIARSKMENESIIELTTITEDNLKYFLKERFQTCKSLDHCTTFIESSSLKILRVYMKKGPKSALKLLDSYKNYLIKYVEAGKCSDNKCMKNAIKNFKSLYEIINFSEEKALKYNRDLFSKLREYDITEESEKIECKLLSPLSNEIRLKILKILGKGGAYYAQLEREVGLKGGHFNFHLDKLIEADYVSQKDEKGPYSITTNGLKVLRFLFELRQEVCLPNS